MTLLFEIKEQNTQILALLKRKESYKVPGMPSDIPVQFPLHTEEHIVILDDYLKEDENLNTLINIIYKYFLNIIYIYILLFLN